MIQISLAFKQTEQQFNFKEGFHNGIQVNHKQQQRTTLTSICT